MKIGSFGLKEGGSFVIIPVDADIFLIRVDFLLLDADIFLIRVDFLLV